jgi:hypothetical protein
MGTYIRTYSLFKSERLSINIELYKDVIRSIMVYACPTWDSAADARLLKLQIQQNRVLSSTGNFDRRPLVHELHVAFRIPYVQITQLNYAWK